MYAVEDTNEDEGNEGGAWSTPAVISKNSVSPCLWRVTMEKCVVTDAQQ